MIQIYDPYTLTPQEIFDAVVVHLFNQGRQSISPQGNCLYRAHGELACAAGIFLTDEQAAAADEKDQSAWDYISEDVLPGLGKGKNALIHQLQIVHDLYTNWESEQALKNHLLMVADTFKLDCTILNNVNFKESR